MLDLSGKEPIQQEKARGKGSLSFLSYVMPTPLALAIFLAIVVVAALLYLILS